MLLISTGCPGASGQSCLIIDQKGVVTVESVASYKGDRGFIQPTRIALTKCRYDIPTKDGKPVRARYKVTIPFTL